MNNDIIYNITLQILCNIEKSEFKLKERTEDYSFSNGNKINILTFTNLIDTVKLEYREDALHFNYTSELRNIVLNVELYPTEFDVFFVKDERGIKHTYGIECEEENEKEYIKKFSDIAFEKNFDSHPLYDFYKIMIEFCYIKYDYSFVGEEKEKYEKMLYGE